MLFSLEYVCIIVKGTMDQNKMVTKYKNIRFVCMYYLFYTFNRKYTDGRENYGGSLPICSDSFL